MKDQRPSLADAVRQLGQTKENTDGAPPDVARLLAWRRGELPPEEAQAVEERLAWSREDARLLADWQDFSTGEAPALAESDLDTAWQRFAATRQDEESPAEASAAPPLAVPERPRALPAVRPAARSTARTTSWRPYLAAASLLIASLAVGWGVWQGRRDDRLEREPTLAGTADWPPLDLFADGTRSGAAEPAAVSFAPGAGGIRLVLRAPEALPDGRHTLRILDARGGEERRQEASFAGGRAELPLARGDLPSGRHTIEVQAAGRAMARYEISLE